MSGVGCSRWRKGTGMHPAFLQMGLKAGKKIPDVAIDPRHLLRRLHHVLKSSVVHGLDDTELEIVSYLNNPHRPLVLRPSIAVSRNPIIARAKLRISSGGRWQRPCGHSSLLHSADASDTLSGPSNRCFFSRRLRARMAAAVLFLTLSLLMMWRR